jgi:UDP-glucose 4-epimerase
MKILVTGAAGFIGSHVVDALIKERHEVYGVDNFAGGYEENVNANCKFTRLDLRDKIKTENYINNVKSEMLFHLAADATEGRSQFTPISASENNYLAYMYTLVPCIKNKIKKVVLISSMSVYGSQPVPFSEDMDKKPEDVYGITKAAMEDVTAALSRVHGFSYTIIRPHNVYGPRQNMRDPYRNVIAIFLNCLLQGKPYYIYGDGKQTRAFTYIADLVPYILKAGLSIKYNGEIFNIGPDKEYTINEVSDFILRAWFGPKIPKQFQPRYVPFRPLEVVDAYCANIKAKTLLGYTTSFPLQKGLQETIQWARRVGPQRFSYIPLELENANVPEPWKKRLI